MANKFNIFDILKRIVNRDTDFTPDEMKSIAPVVIIRWFTGTKNGAQIVALNECVNKYVFSLYKHPELLVSLMSVTARKMERYSYIKRKSSAAPTKYRIQVISEYHGYSVRNAKQVLPFLDAPTILHYADEIGYDKKLLTLLKKELKAL